jgi:superfamily II DNA helicase RecQ
LEAFILEDIILDNINYISLELIIYNINSILNNNFNTYINLLIKNNIEVRIYLNKIHTLLLESNFRPILKDINSLLKFKIPLIFINTTLLISLINILNKAFFLESKNNIIIRDSSNQNNISYNIIYNNSKLKEENILNIISIFKSKELNFTNKALIFINSTKKDLALNKLLNIDFYYSNNSNKKKILNTFLELNNKSLILLITSTLGLGVNFNIITFILYIIPLYSLLDFL